MSVAVDRGGRTWWVSARGDVWIDDGEWRRLDDALDVRAVIPAGDGVAFVRDATVTGDGWSIRIPPGDGAVAVDPRRRVFLSRDATTIAISDSGALAPLATIGGALALSPDRRRLYIAAPTGLHRVALDDATVEPVVAWPDSPPTALALGPAGAIAVAGDRLIGVNLRQGRTSAIRTLPPELHGAAIAIDHRSMIALATAGGVWSCRGDGSDLVQRR
jgi:hypothetical protein